MKSLTIILSAALLLVALPSASAADDCPETTKTSYVTHPVEEGTYIFLDPSRSQHIGVWEESNDIDGLQTDECIKGGMRRYFEDTKLEILA